VAVTGVTKENEKTDIETGTPDKAESVCDSEAANVHSGKVAVPVEDFQDRTEEEEEQAGEEVKSNAETQNEEEEEEENKRTKKNDEEKKWEDEEGEQPSEPDTNKSESAQVSEVKSSSPVPDHCQRNMTEPMEICSGVDAVGRQQKETGEKVSSVLYF
jgi:hypothetical protein